MMTAEDIIIDMKCRIIDILAFKQSQGLTEIPVSDLLYELGMDESTNLTGLDPEDTIELTSNALNDIEATKAQIRRGRSTLQ